MIVVEIVVEIVVAIVVEIDEGRTVRARPPLSLYPQRLLLSVASDDLCGEGGSAGDDDKSLLAWNGPAVAGRLLFAGLAPAILRDAFTPWFFEAETWSRPGAEWETVDRGFGQSRPLQVARALRSR